MNGLDRPARSASVIAPLLACVALVATPAAAMSCAGRPAARVPTRIVLVSPSPNEDEAAKSSTQKAPQSNSGNASSGATSQGSASAGAASQQKQ